MTEDTSIPALTERSQKRLDAGSTEGAGTMVCVKCAGPKEPRRINSDKCGTCNTSARATPKTGVSRLGRGGLRMGVHYTPEPALYAALEAEATKRGMTLPEYIDNGMRRVIKKDAGWVAPNLTDG